MGLCEVEGCEFVREMRGGGERVYLCWKGRCFVWVNFEFSRGKKRSDGKIIGKGDRRRYKRKREG